MSNQFPTDTPKLWGYFVSDEFRELPKTPMLLAGMGPPPFSVTLPSGEVRYIVEEPETTELTT